MITHPNCKVNLGLHVVNHRDDGYHNIESIFLPVTSLCDELEIEPDASLPYGQCLFVQEGIKIDSLAEDNLCVRAYRLLQSEFPDDIKPVRMRLNKQIPFGAGLGGGSSDAAFCLSMLNQLFALNLTREQLCLRAAQLGADCPFFILNRPAYVTGIGDHMECLDFDLSSLGLRIEIAKPDDSVSTREAYANIIPRNMMPDTITPNLKQAVFRPLNEWKDLFINDFEKSVFSAHPSIEKLKGDFYDKGAVYASMSGSGSAVFALFRQ